MVVEVGVAGPVLLGAHPGNLLQQLQTVSVAVLSVAVLPAGLIDGLDDDLGPAARLVLGLHGCPEAPVPRIPLGTCVGDVVRRGGGLARIGEENDGRGVSEFAAEVHELLVA